MAGFKSKAIFGLVLAFLMLISGHARACQCVMPEFDMKWHTSDAVFSGKVTAITPLEKFRKSALDEMPVTVDIEIMEIYKGKLESNTVTLHSSLNEHTCTGYKFKLGESYLFYAYQRKAETYERWSFYNFPSGTWDIGGLCGGTMPLGEAKSELPALKKYQKESQKSLFGDFKKEIAPLLK